MGSSDLAFRLSVTGSPTRAAFGPIQLNWTAGALAAAAGLGAATATWDAAAAAATGDAAAAAATAGDAGAAATADGGAAEVGAAGTWIDGASDGVVLRAMGWVRNAASVPDQNSATCASARRTLRTTRGVIDR